MPLTVVPDQAALGLKPVVKAALLYSGHERNNQVPLVSPGTNLWSVKGPMTSAVGAMAAIDPAQVELHNRARLPPVPLVVKVPLVGRTLAVT